MNNAKYFMNRMRFQAVVISQKQDVFASSLSNHGINIPGKAKILRITPANNKKGMPRLIFTENRGRFVCRRIIRNENLNKTPRTVIDLH